MIKKYFADFLQTKYTNLENKTIVAFTEQSGSAHEFSVKCSSQGIWFEGSLDFKLSTQKELQEFARLIGDAVTEHRKLAPKISTNTSLAGH
jgi:hypothetical protein